MLQRNLVYTGVTRGKRLVVLAGQRKALAVAVRVEPPKRLVAAGVACARPALSAAGVTASFNLCW
ncbi:MAG: hypothetical protein JO358_17350 [Alphaproteobacteria bacterium]|nr:hypothetical protein [Alphaproteobacteria bacterium]